MKKRILVGLLAALLCLAAACPAVAANRFVFTEKNVSLYEGDTFSTAMQREGVYEGDGEITYRSSRPAVAEVSADGTVTAVSKGDAVIYATLHRNGRNVGQTQMSVKVIRAVKKVTLSTANLSVYEPGDELVAGLLQQDTDYPVIVMPAGMYVELRTTCTPEDASSRAVVYTTTDAGIAKVTGRALKAMQRGECDLTVASAQDPQVTETFHILVTQPVKRVAVSGPEKKVAAGSQLQLTAECSPENASIREVTWSSKNPSVATVDRNGTVTGVRRGGATIVATAADGSKAAGSLYVNVTQPVTGIQFSKPEIPVVVGRAAQARITVLPADATDKKVTWSSSDDAIATVQNGRIEGRKAGTCTVTCTSVSDPEVSATVTVKVSQLVTKIENLNRADELSLLVGGDGVMLQFNVLPEDTSNKALTYTSLHPRVAKVDETGYVTPVGRGTATIRAKATDGSGKQLNVRVTVIQPVTGVHIKNSLIYVERGWNHTVRAIVEPRNANNQKVYWSAENEGVATVKSNGTSTGRVHGAGIGYTNISCYTEDGGFTASTRIRVGKFNEAIMVEELYVNKKNEIKISLRNMSRDITTQSIHFKIECYDMEGNPMICNKDGKSTYFEGTYPYTLGPLERTSHGAFRFKDYVIDEPLGVVVLTVTSWRGDEGVTWYIPSSEQIHAQWTNVYYKPKE